MDRPDGKDGERDLPSGVRSPHGSPTKRAGWYEIEFAIGAANVNELDPFDHSHIHRHHGAGSGIGCILRIYGDDLKVDDLAEAISLVPYRIDRKGERRFPRRETILDCHECYGLHFHIEGTRPCDLEGQVEKTIEYLNQEAETIRLNMTFPGVEIVCLDFLVRWKEYCIQCDYLPPDCSVWRGISISGSRYRIACCSPKPQTMGLATRDKNRAMPDRQGKGSGR